MADDDIDKALRQLPPSPMGDYDGTVSLAPPKFIPPKHRHVDVALGEITIRGNLEEAAVRQSFSEQLPWIQYCFESAALDKPHLNGTLLVVNVALHTDRRLVKQPLLLKSDVVSFPFEQCARSTYGDLERALEGQATVTATIKLSVRDETKKDAAHLIPKGPFAEDSKTFFEFIKMHAREVKSCSRLAPSANGKVIVEFFADPSRSAVTYTITESTLDNWDVEQCVMKKISSWSFPSFYGEEIRFTYPFVFSGTPPAERPLPSQ